MYEFAAQVRARNPARDTCPILNIVDETAEGVLKKGLRKVGLLGAKMIMEEDFYKGRLGRGFGIDMLVPDTDERETSSTG
jgi:aspartate racemase